MARQRSGSCCVASFRPVGPAGLTVTRICGPESRPYDRAAIQGPGALPRFVETSGKFARLMRMSEQTVAVAGERRRVFLDGVRAGTPLLPSILPFGLMAGVAAREAGLDAFASLGMSLVIFAGASQLATAQLLADGAVPLVIVATALIINLRLAMYSASISPYFSGLPSRWKWPLAYLLTDQAYAVCIGRFLYQPDRPNPGPRHGNALGDRAADGRRWSATVAGRVVSCSESVTASAVG